MIFKYVISITSFIISSTLFFSNSFAESDKLTSVESYAQLPMLKDIDLSPDGEKFMALVNTNNAYSFGVYQNKGNSVSRLFSVNEQDDLEINQSMWGGNDRIVFSVDFLAKRGNTDTTETRLLSMKPDGSGVIPLFKKTDKGVLPTQIQDNIVSLLPHDPENILVQYRDRNQPYTGVYKVNIYNTKNHPVVERGKKNIYWWGADINGAVRVGVGVDNQKDAKLIIKMTDGKWKDFSHRVSDENSFSVHSISDRPNIFYVSSNHEGGTHGMYEFDIDTDSFVKRLHKDSSNDVIGVFQDINTGIALGVYVAAEEVSVYWLESSPIKRHIDALSSYFKDHNIWFRSINDNKTKAVVSTNIYNRPSDFYLYDMQTHNLTPLGAQYPGLQNAQMGEIFSTTYKARDELEIPAFVTLPPGINDLDNAQSLPFVILPHGGPNARDFIGFDFMAQFVASRGYGVLQMNFRGSTGYGEEFRSAGDKQWGQAMQDDITDGAKWLVSQGYADKDKLVIMGGSYGGYAALMGAVKTPDLYQCAISFAGVTDLPDLLTEARKYVNGRYRTRYIGNLWGDKKSLLDNSPTSRTTDIKVPILLMHGEDDQVVDVSQSKKMYNRLKKAGKDVTYFEFDKGDHFLSLYRNRLKFLQETEKFLTQCTS